MYIKERMKPVRVDDITGIIPFIASVDWVNDRWLYLVFLFHFICFVNIIVFRTNHIIQTTVFVVLMVSVYGAEYINEWAAKNYKLFSTEQYFDSNGLFFSVFYSFPALINCCVVLLFWLYESGVLMFNARRQAVKRSRSACETSPQQTARDAPQQNTDTAKKRERLRRRPRIEESADDAVNTVADKKDD